MNRHADNSREAKALATPTQTELEQAEYAVSLIGDLMAAYIDEAIEAHEENKVWFPGHMADDGDVDHVGKAADRLRDAIAAPAWKLDDEAQNP